MSDLKPCPFCGGTKIKRYGFRSSDLHGFIHVCEINGEAMVKIESRFFKTEEEATEAWNRRAGNVHDTNVGDTISRQTAIERLNFDAELLRRTLDDADVVGVERAKYEWGLGLIESYIADVNDLPSAQPQIVRCKDCAKHEYCRTSTVWAIPPKDDWYCADAERRTDG